VTLDPSRVSGAFEKKVEELRERSKDSVDGFVRKKALEDEIDQRISRILAGPDGDFLLDYLKSITTQVVLPASASDAELRMLEGGRRIVGILDTRRRRGENL